MRRVLIFQHMDHDNAGRFMDFFAEDGSMPVTVRLWEGAAIPSLADFDLLLVLGGAQHVWEADNHPWLDHERQAIREWVGDRAKPYIGLCLGHQLLADAMGGTVGLAERSEVGVFDIMATGDHPLFHGLAGPHKVMEWHFAEVKTLPPGAVVLASSAASKIQAMALGDHAIGLQFHAEFTPQSMASWESLPGYISSLETSLGKGAYQRLLHEALPLMPAMGAMTRRIYNNLMHSAGMRKAA